jgi:hypothetical protein
VKLKVPPGRQDLLNGSQARILAYAQAIRRSYVPWGEAEKRRGFDRSRDTLAEQAGRMAFLGFRSNRNLLDLCDGTKRRELQRWRDRDGAMPFNVNIGGMRHLLMSRYFPVLIRLVDWDNDVSSFPGLVRWTIELNVSTYPATKKADVDMPVKEVVNEPDSVVITACGK